VTVRDDASDGLFRLGRFLVDIGPLKTSREFRLLFAARAVSMLTFGILTVAVNWQVFDLTRSSLQVGLVSFCLAASTTTALLLGGNLADRYDRRLLMMISRCAYPAVFGLLFVNSLLAAPSLGLIYLAVILGGLGAGIGMPALMAATAAVLPQHQLAAASALTAIAVQAGALIGPSIAGVLIAGPGLAVCYAVIVAGALAVLPAVYALRPLPSEARASGNLIRMFMEGCLFIRTSPIVRGLLLIDLAAVLFASPFPLLPQVGVEVLHGDSSTVGLLYTAPAVGALLAALTSGWLGRAARPGAVLVTAVVAWGLAVAAIGAMTSVTAVLLLLGAAGFADAVSEILRLALLQSSTPKDLQGRVTSLWMIQATVSPAAGGLQMGAMARLFSPGLALVAGGTMSAVLAAWIGAAVRSLRTAARAKEPSNQP
jgi:ENTS family enterobactin (siderophore) exporter